MVRKIIIIIPIALLAEFLLLIVGIPVLGFQYTFWKIHQILDNVPESELIDRTKDLPEVKPFLKNIRPTRTSILTFISELSMP